MAGADGCAKWVAAESALFQHVDMVPFVNTAVPTFGAGREFELSQNGISPQHPDAREAVAPGSRPPSGRAGRHPRFST